MRHSLLTALCLSVCVVAVAASAVSSAPVDIGSRLELLVDDYLVESFAGAAQLQLHRPERQEVVFRTDAPWEGNASAYQSVFKDGDVYRMYYRGLQYQTGGEATLALENHPWNLCLATSTDGLHWERPKLGIAEFNGSTDNNIVLTPAMAAQVGGDPAHTAVLLDANPACPLDERIKIVVLGSKPKTGLYLFKSGDGVHFSVLTKEPIVTEGAFDSQNLLFWDPVREEYREYHRGFKDGVRGIMTSAAKTLTEPFPPPQWLEYPGLHPEHLYTNQIQPYYRAPHLFVGFPMRYTDRGWSEPVVNLPGLPERLTRAASGSARYGTAVTDAVFMTSRDGLTFRRWPEAFIRPGPRQHGSWVYGDNFVFWGMIETPSALADAPNEISLYATENYWEGVATNVRRYTIRMDGFVSAYAPMAGGEVVTTPLRFEGGNLALNFETSGAGSVQVELQDEAGKPIEGYRLDDCPPIYGDHLRYVVRWAEAGGDLRALAGKAVRLRFVLKDADLYAFQFVPYSPDPPLPNAAGLIPRKSRDRGPFVAFSDDFQGVPAGVSPTTDDLDPVTEKEKTGWRVIEGSPDRVQVRCDDPPGSGKQGTTPYLSIVRRDEKRGEGGCAWLVLSPQDAADTTNGVVRLSARVFVPSTNAYLADIDAFDDQPEGFHKRCFHVRFSPQGVVSYYDSEKEQPIAGLTLKPDTWQDVLIVADLKQGTFDLTVAGQTARGLPFTHPGIHRLQTILFGPNASKCALYVGAVKLEVEP